MTAELRRAVESHRAGRLDEAEAILRGVVAATPHDARAHFQLGVIALERGSREEAERKLREAVALDGALAEAWAQLALCAGDRGAPREAVDFLGSALRLKPAEPRYWTNLAAQHLALGEAAPAAAAAREALALDGRRVLSHVALGRALGTLGDEAGALQALRRAHEIDPSHPEAAHWLGVALARAGRWTESLRLWEAAAQAQPERPGPRVGIANALLRLGRAREASLAFAMAAMLAPERAAALESRALYALQLGDFTPAEVFAAHEAWGARHAGAFVERPVRRAGEGRLRIGYLSPRFQRSAQAFALLPVLAAHDRSRFEIYCYAELEAADAVTEQFRAGADAWRETQGQGAEAVAQRIRADGIDVLVDLAGHTPGNRLDVFARRPAPVALSWLDYFDTTGVAAIDALVGDDTSLAEPRVQRFIEFPVSAGPVRYPYAAPGDRPVATPVAGESPGPFTFASFARRAKVGPAVIAAWSRILRSVPGSRLLLKNDAAADPEAAQALVGAFVAHGVEAGRITLRPEGGHHEMLAELLEADLVLDTFPYNGGITTCEALSMARPVVTLRGETLIGRQGASLLGAAGVGELVAKDVEGYVALAIALAGDRPRIARLSTCLHQSFAASPVCDAPAFTRRLEALYARLFAELAPLPGSTT